MDTSAKENLPPMKTKRAVFVSDMFNKRDKSKSSRHINSNSILKVTPAGIAKTKSKSSSSKKPRHSHSTNLESIKMRQAFAVAADDYRTGALEGAAKYKSELLQPAHQELIARVDHLGMEESMPDEAADTRPLEDEDVEIETTGPDGCVTRKSAKLGEMMQDFEDLVNAKQVEFEKLFKELHEVDAEIATTRKDIGIIEETEVKQIKRKWAAALDRQTEELQKARQLAHADIAKAIKEDKRCNEEAKRKMDELLRSLA